MSSKRQHPNMVVRRMLLDGAKLIEPYRDVLRKENRKSPDDNCAKEVELMDLWIKTARAMALDLKRQAAQESQQCNCWFKVNALIKRGPLQGNGWDKTAERNGIILAANAILPSPPPPGENHG